MGLFKDIKDVGQMGKQLGDHHGGMPTWKQGMSTFRALANDGGESEVLAQGEPATARVLGAPMPVPGNQLAMQVDLEVHPEHGSPYNVRYAFPTTRMNAPLLMGTTVPIKIMPSDPQRVAVHWQAQQANVAAQGGAMNAAMAGMESMYEASANDAMKAAMAGKPPTVYAPQGAAAPPAAATPEDRLAKLEDLRAKGALSELEYQEQRRKIIAEL